MNTRDDFSRWKKSERMANEIATTAPTKNMGAKKKQATKTQTVNNPAFADTD
jgi:hypothetical protein